MTARTARTSSAGSVSLTRKPLAPARIASNTYSSRSNVVRMTTRVAARRSSAAIRRVAVQPVDARHAHVHQHDVGAGLDRLAHGVVAVGRLADDGDVGLGVEEGAEPGPDEGLVVGEQDGDHDADALPDRQAGVHAEPAARRRPDLDGAAERGRPLAHAGDAVAGAPPPRRRRRRSPRPSRRRRSAGAR